KVDVFVRFEPTEEFTPGVRLNTPLVRVLLKQLGEAAPERADEIRPELLLNVPGVIIAETGEGSNEELDREVVSLVHEAIDKLIAERRREGEALREASLAHCRRMRELRDL